MIVGCWSNLGAASTAGGHGRGGGLARVRCTCGWKHCNIAPFYSLICSKHDHVVSAYDRKLMFFITYQGVSLYHNHSLPIYCSNNEEFLYTLFQFQDKEYRWLPRAPSCPGTALRVPIIDHRQVFVVVHSIMSLDCKPYSSVLTSTNVQFYVRGNHCNRWYLLYMIHIWITTHQRVWCRVSVSQRNLFQIEGMTDRAILLSDLGYQCIHWFIFNYLVSIIDHQWIIKVNNIHTCILTNVPVYPRSHQMWLAKFYRGRNWKCKAHEFLHDVVTSSMTPELEKFREMSNIAEYN